MPNSESAVYFLPVGNHPWGVGDHPRGGRWPSMAVVTWSEVQSRVGTPHNIQTCFRDRRGDTQHVQTNPSGGRVGSGWARAYSIGGKNNTTSWLHLASWNLPDSQLSWESKMEPECGKNITAGVSYHAIYLFIQCWSMISSSYTFLSLFVFMMVSLHVGLFITFKYYISNFSFL